MKGSKPLVDFLIIRFSRRKMAYNTVATTADYRTPPTDKSLHMSSSNIGRIVKSSLLVIALAGACFVLFDYETGSAYSSQLLFFSSSMEHNNSSAETSMQRVQNNSTETSTAGPPLLDSSVQEQVEEEAQEGDELLRVLRKASMPNNNTVILTTINEAFAAPNSILDLFLESFRLGNNTSWLLQHVMIVSLDDKAHSRCKDLQLHCYFLRVEGLNFSSEAKFMTPIYLKMMWRRTEFLSEILQHGFNFLFTDVDIMWFRNPFLQFFPDADFQIACDDFNGDTLNKMNRPNGGFIYALSNNKTIEFYKFWLDSRRTYPGLHEQNVLNRIKFHPYLKKIGLKMRFLDTVYFGGFCEPSRDLTKVCTMHANCCKGLDNKIQDLSLLLEDWKSFISLPENLQRSDLFRWSVPNKCKLSVRPKPTVVRAKGLE